MRSIAELARDLYPKRSADNTELNEEQFKDKFDEYINKEVEVPLRFNSADITTLDERLKNYKFDGKKGLYIWGGCGTGKTHALYAIARAIFANTRKTVQVVNIVEFLNDIKSTYDNKYEDAEQIIKTKVILCIDDIGTENLTTWSTEQIYRVINFRYEQMLPTFFATNLSPQEMSVRLGDRIMSRIAEMCEMINLNGEDKRV
jgi:DNA replication protein DnaC